MAQLGAHLLHVVLGRPHRDAQPRPDLVLAVDDVELGNVEHPEHITGWLKRALRAEVAAPSAEQGGDACAPAAIITHSLEYLEKRLAQIQYATFAAQGYPVGSGSVESANKLVVEARLKGAGMRWARAHVNPLVALRTVACSDRWEEAWPQITVQWRAQVWTRRRERATARRQAAAAAPPPVVPAPLPATAPPSTAPAPVAPSPARRGPRRPAADHPWRHAPLGQSRCA